MRVITTGVALIIISTPAASWTAQSSSKRNVHWALGAAKKKMAAQPRDPFASKKAVSKAAKKYEIKGKMAVAKTPGKGFAAIKPRGVAWKGTALDSPQVASFFSWLNKNGADTSKVKIQHGL